MARLDAIESEAEQEFVLLQRGCAKTNLRAGTKANWGNAKPRLKELQQEYKDSYAAATSGRRTGALLGLLPHIARFVTDHAQARKRAGRADFDDLLFWARDLLRDSRSAQEPAGVWRQLRPAPGRLTVVGDPKQSIYRFRRPTSPSATRCASKPCEAATSRSPRAFAPTRRCWPR